MYFGYEAVCIALHLHRGDDVIESVPAGGIDVERFADQSLQPDVVSNQRNHSGSRLLQTIKELAAGSATKGANLLKIGYCRTSSLGHKHRSRKSFGLLPITKGQGKPVRFFR